MDEPVPVKTEEIFSSLPPVWRDGTLRLQIAGRNSADRRCIVALDDDPTGTQTVHDIWVLTRWEEADLRSALADGEAALYILTNSRSMALEDAQRINREIARKLVEAARVEKKNITIVSRSDSTLRGHYPGEVDALCGALSEYQGLPFDGVCLVPFFPEGGRFTIGDIHWIQERDYLVPAAQTPYARDAVFGYQHSYLPDWVEEKTAGRVKSSEVHSISIQTLRSGGPAEVTRQLMTVKNSGVVVVNAAAERDLEVFVLGLLVAEEKGKRFLFRTAASFVKIAAGLSDKPLLTSDELLNSGEQTGGGLIIFGSYVPKSTTQLACLQKANNVDAVELRVRLILDESRREEEIAVVTQKINKTIAAGKDALVYSSREVVTGRNDAESLSIGQSVSRAMIQVVHGISQRPRFVIGKGGITCSDLATMGMGVSSARVMGQILPGVPVWKLGQQSRWPGSIYVVFPGNVGDEMSVVNALNKLRGNADTARENGGYPDKLTI